MTTTITEAATLVDLVDERAAELGDEVALSLQGRRGRGGPRQLRRARAPRTSDRGRSPGARARRRTRAPALPERAGVRGGVLRVPLRRRRRRASLRASAPPRRSRACPARRDRA